jgi:hypothetical protein
MTDATWRETPEKLCTLIIEYTVDKTTLMIILICKNAKEGRIRVLSASSTGIPGDMIC